MKIFPNPNFIEDRGCWCGIPDDDTPIKIILHVGSNNYVLLEDGCAYKSFLSYPGLITRKVRQGWFLW